MAAGRLGGRRRSRLRRVERLAVWRSDRPRSCAGDQWARLQEPPLPLPRLFLREPEPERAPLPVRRRQSRPWAPLRRLVEQRQQAEAHPESARRLRPRRPTSQAAKRRHSLHPLCCINSRQPTSALGRTATLFRGLCRRTSARVRPNAAPSTARARMWTAMRSASPHAAGIRPLPLGATDRPENTLGALLRRNGLPRRSLWRTRPTRTPEARTTTR